MDSKLKLEITKTQLKFIESKADEVLFGGAAGGGKSYGQLVDALLFALKYPRSIQLVLRRTFPELEHSLIMNSLLIYPASVASYKVSSRKWIFKNGSVIEFGFCQSETDVLRYQGAEYDIVRFDELTHFTENQYTYLLSRVRGTNGYPKQIKSSTNPGGIGHNWVKRRFIDGYEPGVEHKTEFDTKRLFIPSFVQDNKFLMNLDKDYIKRLEQLPENERRALLFGEWDIFDGQVFTEWKNDIRGYKSRKFSHVIKPFEIPKEWRRFRAFDFGYSKPFAVSRYAVDYDGRAYNYRELYGCAGKPDVGIRWTAQKIADKILELEEDETKAGCKITGIADPAIWNATGSAEGSIAEMMEKRGVYFEKGKNDRLAGKMQVHYRLAFDAEGFPMLYFFEGKCSNMIRTLPELKYDSINPEDVDTKQEDHLYDALKYFLMSNPITPNNFYTSDNIEEYSPIWTEKNSSFERFIV